MVDNRPLPIDTYPATTRQILVTIKRLGEATVSELAGHLGLSEAGIRGPLSLLEASGLVAHNLVGRGPGRRKHSYTLTESGNEVFPSHSSDLWGDLLGFLEQREPAMLEEFWDSVAERKVPSMFRQALREDDPRIANELESTFEERGFLVDVDDVDDEMVITVYHCPYLALARKQTVVCDIERDALANALPGRDVRREEHQVVGDRTCVYRIQRSAVGAR